MKRRSFISDSFTSMCLLGAAERVAVAGMDQPKRPAKRAYPTAKLLQSSGTPLRLDDLSEDRAYVFAYPYITTPCFLLRLPDRSPARGQTLKDASGVAFTAPAGLGPRSTIVAYSAICTHKLSHPTRTVSFINYQPQADSDSPPRIRCCSERSIYDPTAGAEVLAGPAPQPLASIVLEVATDNGELSAIGVHGGTAFDQFFERFEDRLMLEHRITDVRKLVDTNTLALPAEQYSATQIRCG